MTPMLSSEFSQIPFLLQRNAPRISRPSDVATLLHRGCAVHRRVASEGDVAKRFALPCGRHGYRIVFAGRDGTDEC